jgi:catechol 2,3-dioxygenase-like lactoylglutathione lyase family enzyme
MLARASFSVSRRPGRTTSTCENIVSECDESTYTHAKPDTLEAALTLKRIRSAVMLYLLLACVSIAPAQTQAPAAMSIDHVAIYVADLKTSVAFYKDVFGFQQIPMPVTVAAWLSMGHGIALHIVAGRKQPVSNAKWDHLSIACDNMDQMIATLNVKHIPWASMEGTPAPHVRFDGVKQIFIQDPDGYWIEINDALKKR